VPRCQAKTPSLDPAVTKDHTSAPPVGTIPTAGLNQRIEPLPATHLLVIVSIPTKAHRHPVAWNRRISNTSAKNRFARNRNGKERESSVKHLGSSRLVGLHTHSTTRPAAGLSSSSDKRTNSLQTYMAPLETHPTSSRSRCWFS